MNFIWNPRNTNFRKSYKAFSICRLCEFVIRHISSIWCECLAWEFKWKIRIIFSDTTSYEYKLYRASILFPFVGLVFGKISNQARCFFVRLLIFFIFILACANPIFISSTNQAKQRFVEMHLNEFECGSNCYFQDILQGLMSLVGKNRLVFFSSATIFFGV